MSDNESDIFFDSDDAEGELEESEGSEDDNHLFSTTKIVLPFRTQLVERTSVELVSQFEEVLVDFAANLKIAGKGQRSSHPVYSSMTDFIRFFLQHFHDHWFDATEVYNCIKECCAYRKIPSVFVGKTPLETVRLL